MNEARHRLSADVRQLIIERLRLDHVRPGDIEEEAPLFGGAGIVGGLGLDSIDALELVLGIEQRFGVTVEDEESGNRALQSVASLCRFIEEQRAHGPTARAGGEGAGQRSAGVPGTGGSSS